MKNNYTGAVGVDAEPFDEQEMWVRRDGTIAGPLNLRADTALTAIYNMIMQHGLSATLDYTTAAVVKIGTKACVQYNEFLLRHRPADWHAIKRREDGQESRDE